MLSYKAFDQHIRTLSRNGRPFSVAGDGRFGLSWHEQRQTAHRQRQSPLPACAKAQRARGGNKGKREWFRSMNEGSQNSNSKSQISKKFQIPSSKCRNKTQY